MVLEKADCLVVKEPELGVRAFEEEVTSRLIHVSTP
jgi:hypothetical protein